jgi:hypothetical protein
VSTDEDTKQALRDMARRDYKAFSKVDPLWHPTYRQECQKINQEARGNARRVLNSVLPEGGIGYVSER